MTEKKSLAEIQREKVNVTSNIVPEMEETKEEAVAEKDPEPEADVVEEKVDEAEEKIEEHEATEEELKEAKAEADTAAAKAKIQKRIDKEVAKRKAVEAERDELKRKLEAKPDADKALTEEDVETRAERKAAEKDAQREFVKACNRVADAALKVDKEFTKKVDSMAEEIGPIPGHMIGILDDLDNGGEVLSHLANNVDEAEEMYKFPPIKMGVELAKLATKLEKAKIKVKPISKVPAPNEGVGGNNRQGTPQITAADDRLSVSDWIAKRNKEVEAKRARR